LERDRKRRKLCDEGIWRGGGNEYKMVPEIKTSSLWNIVEGAQFPYQDTGTNLYVLQHEFK
jgi:hypothetical protein